MPKERSARVRPESRREPLAMDDTRAPREREDESRVDNGMELTIEEREKMLRDDALQNQLPAPPKRDGIHWFWASLTNTYTTVNYYRRLGYRPVKFEELSGWADANMRGASGEYAGCITVNEMLLMKIDESSYQRFMKVLHHDKPMQEQEKARRSVKRVSEEVAGESGKDGLVHEIGTGFSSLDRRAKRPAKFE